MKLEGSLLLSACKAGGIVINCVERGSKFSELFNKQVGGVELFKILNKQERSCCNKSKAIKVTIIGILLHYVIQF